MGYCFIFLTNDSKSRLDRIYKISSHVKLGHIAASYILYIKAKVVSVCLSMCSLRFPNPVPTSLSPSSSSSSNPRFRV